MKMRKVLAAFLALICAFSALQTSVPVASATDTAMVYAETSASLRQGDYGYCYLYLDDLTDLASLTVAVHYDPEKVKVISSYNQVSCDIYDAANHPGCLQYSYIFSGEGENQKTRLFYFRYQILEDAAVGKSYFDIVVSDAYNTSLEALPISGSRCSFTITEGQSNKKCTIYGPDRVSTAVQEEFTLEYRISNSQIASGAMSISYDPELFEFVDLTTGGMLSNKAVDVNTSLPGTVYISFVGTEYQYNSNLFQIRFRTIKNVETEAQIQLSVSDLCDLELQTWQCSGRTTRVSVAYDETYTEDAPSMSLSATFNEDTNKVTVVVTLDPDSHLGAGDFVLKFDPACLEFTSAQKGFTPTFFNINDKKIAEGELKFSILSLSDITDAQTVLTVEFDTVRTFEDRLAVFEISGSGLCDAMTDPIVLNFVDADVTIPLSFVYGDADGSGVVNGKDLLRLRRYMASYDFETGVEGVAIFPGADANGDGVVNGKDVFLLRQYMASYDYDTGESSVVLGP